MLSILSLCSVVMKPRMLDNTDIYAIHKLQLHHAEAFLLYPAPTSRGSGPPHGRSRQDGQGSAPRDWAQAPPAWFLSTSAGRGQEHCPTRPEVRNGVRSSRAHAALTSGTALQTS